jgi:Siphovirus Gp157
MASTTLMLDFETPAPAKRAGLSLVDRITEVELIAATLDELDADELTPEIEAMLKAELVAAIHGTKDKVDRTAGVLAAFTAAAEGAAAEIARLETRKKYFDRQHDRLTRHVLDVLIASGKKALDGHTSTFTSKLNPPAVVIDDAAAIPAAFLRTPPPPAAVPDKTAIKNALKLDAAAVPGARLAQTTRLVRA